MMFTVHMARKKNVEIFVLASVGSTYTKIGTIQRRQKNVWCRDTLLSRKGEESAHTNLTSWDTLRGHSVLRHTTYLI